MPGSISKPTIKVLIIQDDRPGYQETSYRDSTCFPWLTTTLYSSLYKKESKDLRVFLQNSPNKLDHKYCHTP